MDDLDLMQQFGMELMPKEKEKQLSSINQYSITGKAGEKNGISGGK